MSGLFKKVAGVAGSAALMLTQASAVLAQYDYEYDDYYYDEPISEAGATLGAGMSVFMIVVWCCSALLGLGYFVFWVMMLLSVIKNAPDDQKTLWIVLMLFVPFMAFVYFFTKKKEWEGSKPAAPKAEEPKASE